MMATARSEVASSGGVCIFIGRPRFPLKGSFKGDIDMGIDIDIDMGCCLGT